MRDPVGTEIAPLCVMGFDLGADGAVATAGYPTGDVTTARLVLPDGDVTERAWWWWNAVVARLDERQPIAVAYEDANYVGAKAASQNWLRRQEAMLVVLCKEREILVVPVPTPTWRAHMRRVTGAGPIAKGESKVIGQRLAAMLGWIPAEAVGAKRYEGRADAAWIADWMRHQPIEVAE